MSLYFCGIYFGYKPNFVGVAGMCDPFDVSNSLITISSSSVSVLVTLTNPFVKT